MLNYQVFGEPTERATLVIAPGLFGTGRNWRAIARQLSRKGQVVTVDMRNHGESFWHEDHTYFHMAEDLLDLIAHLGRPVSLMGHSMGGKAAMVAAVLDPNSIDTLLVADIAPVGYKHSQISNVDVMQSLDLNSIASRRDANEIMSSQILDESVRAFLLQSLEFDQAGKARWTLNLDALRSNMDDIIGFPELRGTYQKPAFFIRGELSDYVSEDEKPLILKMFPKGRVLTIKEAGHWLHADKPRVFIEMVDQILG